jgi:EF hand
VKNIVKVVMPALVAAGMVGAAYGADDSQSSKPAAAEPGATMNQPNKDAQQKPNESAKPAKDSAQSQQPSNEVTAQMKQLDADRDGTISKAEAKKLKGLSEGFDAADKNKDGVLDSSEFAAAISDMKK